MNPCLKKVRREERMGRPNPFINYRSGSQEESSSDEEETPSVIMKWYDVSQRKALLLDSNGKQHLADTYEQGEHGFMSLSGLSIK